MKTVSTLVCIFAFAIFRGYCRTTLENCSSAQTVYPPDPESGCCGNHPSYRLIGGQYADIDQYPWLVLIEYDTANGTKFLCGGTLISSRYVLTAAHCVIGHGLDLVTPKSIRLGEHDTSNDGLDCTVFIADKDCTDPVLIIPIEEAIPHPNYDLTSRRDDIALIRLKTAAPHTDFIQPICLPTSDISTLESNSIKFWSAGWGASSKDNVRSNLKQHAYIPFVTREACQQFYNVTDRRTTLWEKQICAGGEKEGDSCKGDSGGPLMFQNPQHLDLVGVISFGNYPCGSDLRPAVYTDVYKYKDWIHNTIKT